MKTFTTTVSALVLLGAAVLAAQSTPKPQTPPEPSTSPRSVGTSGTRNGPNGEPAATLPRSADVMPDYRLVPGDKLRIEVYKDPQVSQSVQVRPDGKITLPLVNDIMAVGRTPAELRDAIGESLKSYIATPTVTVIVVETVPPVIYVMGEVNSAGPQPLIGRLDVVQALSSAGGFRDFANTKNIRIRRGNKIIRFNYNDAIKGEASQVFLQPGDTVIVP